MWGSLWLGCGSALCAGAVWLCAASDRGVAVCSCDCLCRNGLPALCGACLSEAGSRALGVGRVHLWEETAVVGVCDDVGLCDVVSSVPSSLAL